MSDEKDINNDNKVEDNNSNNKEHICSMCRREESKTGRQLEMMPGMYVCIDCLEKGMNVINSNENLNNLGIGKIMGINLSAPKTEVQAEKKVTEEISQIDLSKILKPHEIKYFLDKYVIGQERAKKVVSVAAYNHYKRVAAEVDKDVEIQKSNILLIGPTGSGKTYLVQTLAKILEVPLAITDATSLTEAGYIGDDIESVLSKLLMEANNDLELAQRGIVFIDEIDKIAKKRETHARDVSGESVQQGLLKLLEGNKVEVPVGATSKNALAPLKTMDTTNILFIVGGAFPNLEDIVKERMEHNTTIGFNSTLSQEDEDYLDNITVEDLRKFGMIPEFLGRLPVVVTMNKLTIDTLVDIISKPQNAIIKQYKELFKIDNVELEFEKEALEVICEEALKKNTGARGLRAVIEDLLLDVMYETPKDYNIGKVVITKDYVLKKGAPLVSMRGV